MKTNINKLISDNWLSLAKKLALAAFAFLSLVGAQVWASNQSTMSQAINNGTKAVDIVDGSGNAVGSPAVAFGALTYSFNTQDGTGTLGTASEKIRAYNPTNVTALTVSIAGSATNATWTDGSNTYDFNDGSGYTDGADAGDSVGGQMTIDPSAGTLAGVSGCATTNVAKGSSSSFNEGTTNSIDLITSTANTSNRYCRWDLTGVGLTQKIPAGQASGGTYNMTLVLSIV